MAPADLGRSGRCRRGRVPAPTKRAGQRPIRIRRSGGVRIRQTYYCNTTGITTTPPSAARTKAIPPTVNPTGDFVEVLGDAGGIGKQAVDGDEGGNRGKDREQAVVGHAGRERENAVLTDVAVDAPSSCRDLGGGAGV